MFRRCLLWLMTFSFPKHPNYLQLNSPERSRDQLKVEMNLAMTLINKVLGQDRNPAVIASDALQCQRQTRKLGNTMFKIVCALLCTPTQQKPI